MHTNQMAASTGEDPYVYVSTHMFIQRGDIPSPTSHHTLRQIQWSYVVLVSHATMSICFASRLSAFNALNIRLQVYCRLNLPG